MKFSHLFPLAVLAALWLAIPFSAARAAITPLGDISPATDPGTWTGSTDAYIGNTASGTLTVDGGSQLLSGNGYIGSGSAAAGLVNVSGPGSSWSTGPLFVGNSGSGTLSITNGGNASAAVGIGCGSGSTGVITVDGAGSTLSSLAPLIVGANGSGTLSISNGGCVNGFPVSTYIGYGAGSSGLVTVDGVGSKLVLGTSLQGTGDFYVGLEGSGTLSVTNGASASGYCSIGQNSGSMGMVTISGTGSTWTDANFNVGLSGSGTLSIANGAKITGGGNIGRGLVRVDGAGSVWNAAGTSFFIGNLGGGTLSITNGAFVSSTGSAIGSDSGTTGIVTVDGVGSTWTNSGSLFVGYGGRGALSITNHGSVGGSVTYVGYLSNAVGTVTVDGAGSSWTNSAGLYVGNSGRGAIAIVNGGVASAVGVDLGVFGNSNGAVAVDGAGSTLNDTGDLYVGNSGGGTLSVTNGGSVSVAGATYVGKNATSLGAIVFGANGGTLTTQSLFVSPTQLTGTGTINTRGIVSDGDLVFDASHGLAQTLAFQQAGQNVAVNLDLATNPSSSGDLGAGWKNAGSLTIQGGIKVQSGSGDVGYCVGSAGTAKVSGNGSAWTTGYLNVGNGGNGTLSICDGGSVSTSNGCIGYAWSSTGLVHVDGVGSTWSSGYVTVGYNGSGTLSITGGGIVAGGISINSRSLLAIDIGYGSLLSGSPGSSFSNNGTVRIVAAANVATGNYTPISGGSWSGSGVYQPIGGTLNTTTRTFTVSHAATAPSGSPIPLDLASVQRALVDDNGPGGTNWEVGASFVAAGSTTNIAFTATAMSDTLLDSLSSQLSPKEAILSGWMFSADGYAVSLSNPAYLSFKVGAGHPVDELDLWHYDGSAWTEYTPTDLTYDGTFASFTATGLSGYAMIAVPEPGTLFLLGIAAIGLLASARRRQRVC